MNDSVNALNQPPQFRNFYGRRHGKRLSPLQEKLLEEALEAISVPELALSEEKSSRAIDLTGLFNCECPVWLDIGFGSGEHTVHQAMLNPKIGILGCEIYVNGVASLLSKLRDKPLPNIRIHLGDIRDLMDVLPPFSISKAFLLYPDPWPKKRHHQRRFMTSEHLIPLARVMKSGAELRIATDVPDYARQSIEVIMYNSNFEWTANCREDWQQPRPDQMTTRYEVKAINEGRTPIYLTFTRK